MTIKVGITGGIGSGKSTVCKIFKLLGVPVFEADTEAKNLMDSNKEIMSELINLFGSEIYMKDGGVDRKKLADIIFNDDIQLKKVNKIIHPFVRNTFINWIKNQNSAYIIHEAAILFESGFYKMMDFNILISAPEEMRIERVVRRDKISPERVKERIQKQWTDEEKRRLTDVEIKNDNSALIIPQIIEIDKRLKSYGKIW